MLYFSLLPPRVTRTFHNRGQRYLCQFRNVDMNYFVTDCAFENLDSALSYVNLIVRFVNSVAEGKVLDDEHKQVVFTCQLFVDIREPESACVREIPAEYAQIPMFDALTNRKEAVKQKKKIQETLSKLRLLQEELNAQLYAKPTERPTVHSPSDASQILQCFIGHLDHEELWVIDMDTRNRVMNLVALYKGNVNSSQVRVGEVFRQAIIDNAPAIIIAHNHPSGDPTPSPDDVAVTRSITQAGKLLDIDVLDHLVIAGDRFVSLKERGLGF